MYIYIYIYIYVYMDDVLSENKILHTDTCFRSNYLAIIIFRAIELDHTLWQLCFLLYGYL